MLYQSVYEVIHTEANIVLGDYWVLVNLLLPDIVQAGDDGHQSIPCLKFLHRSARPLMPLCSLQIAQQR